MSRHGVTLNPAGPRTADNGRTLELGGRSAAVVLDDAELDLGRIGADLFATTLMNNGRTRCLSTRVLAPWSRYAEAVETFAALASTLAVGDPLDPATQVGPMVSRTHRDRVERYIAWGRAEGARIVTGGGRLGTSTAAGSSSRRSSPTSTSHGSSQEEIAGPVLVVIPYTDEDDAVRIANDSAYGLAGSVWTADPERGRAVARRILTGTIGVNRYVPDPGSPYGGIKQSGLGRALGPEGLAAYQNLKSIY